MNINNSLKLDTTLSLFTLKVNEYDNKILKEIYELIGIVYSNLLNSFIEENKPKRFCIGLNSDLKGLAIIVIDDGENNFTLSHFNFHHLRKSVTETHKTKCVLDETVLENKIKYDLKSTLEAIKRLSEI